MPKSAENLNIIVYEQEAAVHAALGDKLGVVNAVGVGVGNHQVRDAVGYHGLELDGAVLHVAAIPVFARGVESAVKVRVLDGGHAHVVHRAADLDAQLRLAGIHRDLVDDLGSLRKRIERESFKLAGAGARRGEPLRVDIRGYLIIAELEVYNARRVRRYLVYA